MHEIDELPQSSFVDMVNLWFLHGFVSTDLLRETGLLSLNLWRIDF
jgi:hypothetical protein